MEEKAKNIDIDIVETVLKPGLTEEQAHHLAFNIVFDIIDYIKENQEAYIKYLKEQESK